MQQSKGLTSTQEFLDLEKQLLNYKGSFQKYLEFRQIADTDAPAEPPVDASVKEHAKFILLAAEHSMSTSRFSVLAERMRAKCKEQAIRILEPGEAPIPRLIEELRRAISEERRHLLNEFVEKNANRLDQQHAEEAFYHSSQCEFLDNLLRKISPHAIHGGDNAVEFVSNFGNWLLALARHIDKTHSAIGFEAK